MRFILQQVIFNLAGWYIYIHTRFGTTFLEIHFSQYNSINYCQFFFTGFWFRNAQTHLIFKDPSAVYLPRSALRLHQWFSYLNGNHYWNFYCKNLFVNNNNLALDPLIHKFITLSSNHRCSHVNYLLTADQYNNSITDMLLDFKLVLKFRQFANGSKLRQFWLLHYDYSNELWSFKYIKIKCFHYEKNNWILQGLRILSNIPPK